LGSHNGFELLGALRKAGDRRPVILLSSHIGESDRVRGLDLGADDYVTKPFSVKELESRVRAVLRRAVPHGANLRFDALVIDASAHQVFVDGEEVHLTRREFGVLQMLSSAPGRVFSRADLLRDVWGSTPEWQDAETVTEHVRRLRSKLSAAGAHDFISTVRGVGYRFDRA
jgi:DNA-binding response OmpR family regulator